MSSFNYNMIGFLGASPGPFELAIFFSVILILFGARRIPELARTMGRVLEQVRRASQEFKDQIMEMESNIESDVRELDTSVSDLTVENEGEDFTKEETES